MSTFTATGGVRFTDTQDSVSFTAGYASVPTSGGAVDSVNGETGVVVLDVDDVNGRDIYRPAIVMSPATVTAFGGSMVNGVSVTIAALASSVPVGADILIWNGTAGGAPNGSYTHAGSGTFNYSARQYLNATSVANGCGLVEAVDFYTAGSAADSSLWKLATANGTDWALVPTGGYAFKVSLNLDQYALDSDIAAFDAPIARDIPSVAFRCDGTNDGDWHTDNVGSFTGGYDFRAKVRPTYPYPEPPGDWFSEMGTQTRDSLVGIVDNHEAAIMRRSTTEKPCLFFECTRNGGSAENATRLIAELPTGWGEWVTVRTTVNFATTTVRHWVQVWWEFSDDETFDTTDDGKHWWLIGELVDTDYDSIDPAITEVWQVGHNFYGDIAWTEWYSGIDGTRVASPNAEDWVSGSTFDDAEANTWTAQTDARVVTFATVTAP